MAKKTKNIFRLIWVWEEEKEEQWLREMANKGWLLDRYNFGLYTFVKSEPEDYIYKLDYRTDFDRQEYLTIFEDMGWEHVDDFLGWHYFRVKEECCKYPEIYSDNTSKVQKYRSLLKVILVVIFVNTINIFNVLRGDYFAFGFQLIFGGVYAFLIYGLYRIRKIIKGLEDEL